MSIKYDAEHPFDFRNFYNGRFRAWGIATDIFGIVKRRYRIDAKAELDGEQAHLTEKFTYSNGKVHERLWTLNYDAEDVLTGIGTDIEGLIVGTIHVDAIYLDYTVRIPSRTGKNKLLSVDHWQYPIDDSHIMHITTFKKMGIPLLKSSVMFTKIT